MAKRSVPGATPDFRFLEPAWTVRIGAPRALPSVGFLLLVALSVAWSWQPLTTVIGRSLGSGDYQHYSHIVLMPFIAAYLLYLNRDKILGHAHPGPRLGALLAGAGAATIWLAGTTVITGEPEHRLSLAMLGLVTSWAGSFVISHGVRSLLAAAYPFALLLFMVPLPPAVLTAIVVFLQVASADTSAVLFSLIGMPFFRDGFIFALPGLTIQVAEECSGIRSSLALLISGLVMAWLFLRTAWSRTAFILAIVPLAIFKNAVRIVVLSWLAVHVDPSFITGSVAHRSGGIPIFFMSLTVLGGMAWLLRRAETWKSR